MAVKKASTQANEFVVDPLNGRVTVDGKNIPGVTRVMIHAEPKYSRIWVELGSHIAPIIIKGADGKPITFDTLPPVSPRSAFWQRLLCRIFGHRFESQSEWPLRWQCRRCGKFSIN